MNASFLLSAMSVSFSSWTNLTPLSVRYFDHHHASSQEVYCYAESSGMSSGFRRTLNNRSRVPHLIRSNSLFIASLLSRTRCIQFTRLNNTMSSTCRSSIWRIICCSSPCHSNPRCESWTPDMFRLAAAHRSPLLSVSDPTSR